MRRGGQTQVFRAAPSRGDEEGRGWATGVDEGRSRVGGRGSEVEGRRGPQIEHGPFPGTDHPRTSFPS